MNQTSHNLLSILLSLGAFLFTWTNVPMAIADTGLIPAPSLQEEPTEITANEIPPEVQSAVLNDAVKRTSKTVSALSIVSARSQNWSDGCLELAKPDEICTQVITPGWQVVVTDGMRNWTYRTDDSGDLVKLEESP